MNIEISTSDAEQVDPTDIAEILTSYGFFVMSVSVNEGERFWQVDFLAEDALPAPEGGVITFGPGEAVIDHELGIIVRGNQS